MRILMLIVFTIALSAGLAPAYGQVIDPNSLSDLERERIQAQENAARLESERSVLRKDISNLRSNLKKTARETARIEKESRIIEDRLKSLDALNQNYRKQISENREAFIQLMGVLQRIDRKPPPTLLGQSEDILDYVQTSYLISGLSRSLESQSERFKDGINTVRDIEATARAEKNVLDKNERTLTAKRKEINTMVGRKSVLEKSVTKRSQQERSRADQLASDAVSLRDLISSFEKAARDVSPRLKPKRVTPSQRSAARSNPPKSNSGSNRRLNAPVVLPPDTKRFADAKNSLRAPVTGRVTKKYGRKNKGITVATRPSAQVISPYAGRIEFSGPFKNYEKVVIINVGGNYFILMTGLGDVFAETGEDITVGAPLGLMPASAGSNPELYIEFRKNGAPIDPKPWLGTAFAELGG